MIFDYTYYGETVFRPKVTWADRDRGDIIKFDHSRDNEELSKGLKVGKGVELHTTRAIRNLVVK